MNEPKRLGTHWVPVALALAVTGCGGGGSSAPALTPQEQIAQLEASGALPTLERGTSIAGTDANANGVRDDIERHIEKKYTVPAQRAAAMQTARDYQQMLLVDKTDAVVVQALIDSGARASNCSFEVFGGIDGFQRGYQMSRELEAMTTNTKGRLIAYLDFNRAASGSVSSSPKENVCDKL